MSNTTLAQARAKLAELMSQHQGSPVAEASLCAVASGASGRVIMRCESMVGVYWTDERADNNSFLPAAKSLYRAGLRVPKILSEWTDGQGLGACLMTDLGTRDILSYRSCTWTELKAIYQRAFESLLPLYQLSPDWELQPAFDADYYRWEQHYFAEHLLATHAQLEPTRIQSLLEATSPMASYLAALPRVPVHRDCQSQNIMMMAEQAWLIDFQGMRMGRMEYDLASLIYDPYMDLDAEQRQQLLQLWQHLSGQPLDMSIFVACGIQRLMQALGAFANIGHHQQRAWYLEQIPAGLRALHQLIELAPVASTAYQFAQQLRPCLNDVKSQ
ncbi:MAG: phosphotransferase [Akkermansia sp.]